MNTKVELSNLEGLIAEAVSAIKLVYIPHRPTKKRLRFLLLPEDDTLYGEAAGDGKKRLCII